MLPSDLEGWDWGLTNEKQKEVIAILELWQNQRRKLAMAEMRQMAAAGGERRFLQGSEGDGGEVKMMIHPISYHYWGQRLGYECWDQDSDFVREYLRDNPAARVRSRGEHLQVQVGGLGTVAARFGRFHKTYN